MVLKTNKTIGDSIPLHNMNKIYISLNIDLNLATTDRKSCLSKQNKLAIADKYYLSFHNLIPSFNKKTCEIYKEGQETSYLQVEAILMAKNHAHSNT